MKLKHWQGYGTVNAQKVSRTVRDGIVTLVVKVTGNHEWGLVREDEYDLRNWLVKRFDKNLRDHQRISYRYEQGWKNNGRIDEEYCIYTFQYKEVE